MVEAKHHHIVLGYQLPYNLTELQSLYLGVIIPTRIALGASFFQSGTDDLINQQVGINASTELSKLRFGIRVKYWRVSIAGIASLNSISLAAGLQMKLTDQILAGVFMGNLTQSQVGYEEILPIIWFSGLRYKPTSKLTVLTEFGHVLGYNWEFRSGVEYILKERFFTRTGYNLSNKRGYWGLGFQQDSIKIDYAIDFHPFLGFTHQAGFSYSWP